MRIIRHSMWGVAAVASLGSLGNIGWAENCPCRKNVTIIRTVSTDESALPPAPMPDTPAEALGHPPSVPPPAAGPSEEVVPAPGSGVVVGPKISPGMNRWGVMPPPGTLGRTYQRRSALVPDESHPRVGVVLVHLPEDADVTARGLKVKWTGDVWRLETAQALVPGVPHIYAVKAEWDTPDGRVTEVRWVRLIMGREVDLEF